MVTIFYTYGFHQLLEYIMTDNNGHINVEYHIFSDTIQYIIDNLNDFINYYTNYKNNNQNNYPNHLFPEPQTLKTTINNAINKHLSPGQNRHQVICYYMWMTIHH
jgi:hypothetical protein